MHAASAWLRCTIIGFATIKNRALCTQLMHMAAFLPVPPHRLFPSGG